MTSKPMKMRISDIIELILALAFGMALTRACDNGQSVGFYGPRYVVEPMLLGISLVAAMALGCESAMRPTRRPWGIGRWTCAVTGVYLVVDLAAGIAMNASLAWQKKRETLVSVGQSVGLFTTLFYGQLCWLLLACWIVNRLTGTLKDPEPDGREYAGRILTATIILWGFAYRIHMVWGWR